MSTQSVVLLTTWVSELSFIISKNCWCCFWFGFPGYTLEVSQSYKYFPQDQYTVYRTDRPPNKQGQSHGGVLIAVTNEFLSNEAKELKTNCEMVWAELTISNAMISELHFFASCAIGEEQACGFPGLSVSLRAW
jgi:hypothetical protein